MNLQCASCLEPTVAGVRHDCSEVIASLRAQSARVDDVEEYTERLRGASSQTSNIDYVVSLESRLSALEKVGMGVITSWESGEDKLPDFIPEYNPYDAGWSQDFCLTLCRLKAALAGKEVRDD